MSEEKEFRNSLLETFVLKTSVKHLVYQNTLQAFVILRKVLKQLERDYTNLLQGKVANELMPKYKEHGPFEVEFKIGGDVLIFSMHTNVFEFDRDNPVWKLKYVQEDILRSYCGMINIYNFLNDSFKYNRVNDLGYLVARIFINSEKHFFVEGKRQSDELLKDFEVDAISPGLIREIIEIAIQYCVQFDLLVPPYEQVKIATVEQMLEKISLSRIATGKRMGFSFNTDDV
jgi:hypothetical protein